jgi:hydrogenase-4 component B
MGVVAVWAPQWAAADPLLATRTLGGAHTVFACVLLAGGFLILRRIRTTGTRRNLTWDCGYAAPSAHMQYTSGSFAGIARGWFSWLLRPEIMIRRVRGHFPAQAMVLERIPETVLEKTVMPGARFASFVADGAGKMQHGRLHIYILYVFLEVTALGLMILLGGV